MVSVYLFHVIYEQSEFQAKKFIESAPVVVKADIGKEEAEKLMEALSKHGAVCTME